MGTRSRIRKPLVTGAALAAVLATWAAPAWGAAALEPEDEEGLAFKIADSRIGESSGLAVSLTHDNVIYTHNDSDDGPVFYALGADGRTRARFTLSGAAARDWEGMAASVDKSTGRGVLWFGDVGDNFNGAWPDISIYKVNEPTSMRGGALPAVRYRFRYEDGGRNAEGIMVNPRTGRLYVVSKEFGGSIYEAPRRLRTDRVNVLRRVGSAPVMATDAAYAPDGSSFVIRTYLSASLYRAPDELISRLDMPAVKQAESITYTRDGTAVLTGTEGAKSPVYRVPLPREALPTPTPTPKPAAEGEKKPAKGPADVSAAGAEDKDAEAGGVPVGTIALWLVVAVGATAVIAFIARRAH
ncbi:hypothetical protein [Sinosporangium siamense]|uniref:Esterase-like activity of phytase family protein n=1 Tax=Sinosporangium siamense TaxID=1367973 RepID=A0A919RMN7_9ACTN|nr:hypothetical protein [Sinosporangium siamense]GII94809.1 hypothetical protein Ssi02_50400 [Sinosporangium siamense]